MYRGLRALPGISCHVRVSAYMGRYAGFTATEKTSMETYLVTARIAQQLGIHPEALRTWIRQAEIGGGQAAGYHD